MGTLQEIEKNNFPLTFICIVSMLCTQACQSQSQSQRQRQRQRQYINETDYRENGQYYVMPIDRCRGFKDSMHAHYTDIDQKIRELSAIQKTILAEEIIHSCNWDEVFEHWTVNEYHTHGSLFRSQVVPKLSRNDKQIDELIKTVLSYGNDWDAARYEDRFMLLFIMDEYLPQHLDSQQAWDLLDCFFGEEEEEVPFNSFIFDHLERKKLPPCPRMELLKEYRAYTDKYKYKYEGFLQLHQYMSTQKNRKSSAV